MSSRSRSSDSLDSPPLGCHVMSPIQRAIFVTGLLTTTGLTATVAGILLHRTFPDHHWITLVGPLGAAATVMGLVGMLRRK